MKQILSYLLICFSSIIFAQNTLSLSNVNLGTIQYKNDDIVDIHLYNSLAEKLYLLKATTNGNATFRYTNTEFNGGYTEVIRVKLNPKTKGKISETLSLYFSNSDIPVNITITGKVKKLAKDGLQDCPSFKNQKVALNANGVYSPAGEIKAVRTILSKKEEQITFNEEEQQQEEQSKGIEGESNKKENPVKKGEVIQKRKPKRERTGPKVNDRRSEPSIGQILFGKTEDKAEIAKEEPESANKEEVRILDVKQEVTNSNLLDNSFKPNNVVFLIDASTSMRENDKMDLLKKSMIELLEPLRDQDFLSIVTYSGDANVILSPTSAADKEKIKQIINNIEADGSTQAVKGIKKAIQVANSNFISDGNNEILLATDGAFDIGEGNKSLRRKIKSESKNGLIVTVLGIKNEKWTNKSLKEIAELGQGELIKINKPGDTKKVLEEVKTKSQL